MSRDLYRDLVYRIAEEEGVYGPLAEAVIQQESNWDPAATSHAGAQGLMQLMPGTASDLGVEDPLDPEQNIRGGVRYLRQNLEKYDNDIDLALAAYNAGPGNVDKYGGIPPFKETQDYVSRIRGERLPMFMSEYGDFEETSEEEVSAGVDPAGLEDQVVEEEVETRTVFLPDNTWVDAPADMPEEEALQLAREKYPESFNVVGVEIPRGESNSWDAAAAAASRSTFGLIPGLQAAFASATGNEDLYDHAQGRLREESEAAYDIAPNLVTTEEIGKVYDEEGLIPAAAKAMEFGTEQIFQSFGFQAPSIAAGLGVAGAAQLGVLAGLTGPVGVATAGMLAGLGTMFSTFLSENLERSYEEGKIDTKDVNLLRQAVSAGGQTALNSLTYLLVGGKVGTKMLLSPAAREEGFSALGKTLNRLEDLSPVKRMLSVVAEEEVAEIGQQALERYAAGLPVDPRHKGAAEEYAEIALATLAPSLGFAALGGVSSSLSRRAAERKDLDKETDVKKAMMERVTEARLKLEENRRSDALHNLRESAQYQAERDLFLSEAGDLAGITAEDIHALAKERNINSEDVAFHEFSRKATAGIEDKTGKKGGQAYLDGMSPKQLQKMYADIKAMPVQEQPTSLQVVSEKDARSFAGALAKGRKKQKVTKKQVEAKLRALGKIDEGQMEENFLGDLADQYIFRLAEFGLGTKLDDGSIQLKKTDRTLVSESDYQKIMDASRADAGGRFITMGRAKELTGVRGFNRYRAIRDEAIRRGDIVKTGKRYMVAPAKEFTKSFSYRIDEGPQHVVRNDRGEVESTHANQRAADKEKNKLARKIGYIARDEGGNAIGGAGTKQEARQHLSRYFARLRQEAKNAVLNNGVGKLPPIDQASDWIKPTVERRAEEAGEAAVRRAKDNVVGVKPIRRVYTVAKEDGFLIREEKTGADGRVSRSARKDFLAGEEEARARLSELEGRRVGRAAVDRGEEAELVRSLREDPATPLDEELPLPAPEQVSEHAALEEELNKVLASRGLSEFRTEIVEGLTVDARVDPLTLTIQIAMTPGLQSKKIEDQVKALMPLLNHESIHAFRKMGLITKAEWKQLKKWVKTTPVPSEIVNAFNEKQTAAGLETLPDGATYYDMSRVLYADQGNADNWIDDSYVEEAVAFLGQDLTNIAPDPEVKGIFRKIASVLKRVGRALMGRGYRTPKEAFDKLYGPQMVQRAKAGRSLDTWWTDRRLGNDQIRPEYEFAELAGWAESRGRVLGGEQTTEEKVLEALDSVESPDVDVSPGRAAVPRAAEGARVGNWGELPRGADNWEQLPDGRLVGYRVSRSVGGRAVSGADSRQSASMEPGAQVEFEGDGVFVTNDLEYAKTYYGVHDENALQRVAFSRDDVTSGRLADSEPEVSVRSGEVIGSDVFTDPDLDPTPRAAEGFPRHTDRSYRNAVNRDEAARANAEFDEDTRTWSDGQWESVGDFPNTRHIELTNHLSPTIEELKTQGLGMHTDHQRSLVGKNRDIPEGTPVRLRIDVRLWKDWLRKIGEGKYAQTVHDIYNKKGEYVNIESATQVGTALGYDNIARLDGDVEFKVNWNQANKIRYADGKKTPIAVVEGAISQDRTDPRDIPDFDSWIPVGYNPHKSVFFYDKRTGQEVVGGRDAISTGNTVFVREANYGDRSVQSATEEGDRQFAQDRPSRRVGRAAVDRGEAVTHALRIIEGIDSASIDSKTSSPTVFEIAKYFYDSVDDRVDHRSATDSQNKALEDLIFDEALFAVKKNPSALEWYDENLNLTMSVLEEIDPDLKNPDNRFVLSALLAVTSNGNTVDEQFKQSWDTYRHWVDNDGELVGDYAAGDKKKFIQNHIAIISSLVENLGYAGAAEWLSSKSPVSEIRKSASDWGYPNAKKIATTEFVDEVVPHSVIFGPKLGSFFNNLYGDYSTLTMDRWFMRMLGRVAGSQLDINIPKLKQAEARGRKSLGDLSSQDRKMLGLNKKSFTGPNIVSSVGRVNKYFSLAKNREGIAKGTPLDNFRKAVNNLSKKYEPLIESPVSPGHRRWIRARFNNVIKRLRDEGLSIEPADLQALLWYNEKALFNALNYREKKGSDDYAGSAEALHQRVVGRPSRVYATGAGRVAGVGGGPSAERVGRAAANRGETPEAVLRDFRSRTDGRSLVAQEALSRPYRRGTRGTSSALRGLGAPDSVQVVRYKFDSPRFKESFDSAGVPTTDILEISGPGSSQFFRERIQKSKDENRFGSSVYVYDEPEYSGMRLFLSDDGHSGIALKGDDIVSGFSTPEAPRGSVYPLMMKAIDEGGRRADAFDTVLPRLYSNMGMRVVARVPWDDQYAPPGWDYDLYSRFNSGRPDVTYLVYDPDYLGYYEGTEGSVVSSPDDAVSLQDSALEEIDSRPIERVGRAAMSRGIPRGAENPVLRPGTDGQVTLANARWGQIPFNKEGKFDKRGVAYDIFVKEGYDESVEGKSRGFGERHIERHNPDIRDNTPFRDWKELLSEFTKALSKGKKLRSGDIYPAPDGAGRMSFLWDRDDFKEPVVVIMEYVDREGGESLPPKAHHYSVVTAFASDDYGGNVPDGNRRNNTPLHGSRVSTEAIKAYRRPSVARKWNEKQRGRFALSRTDGVPYTPAQRAAQADLNGGIPETDNSLWGQVSSAFPVIDTAFWSEMRRRFLEKFNRLKEIGEMRGARGDTVGSLASSSAWALAMMVDRAGAFLSASFKYGVMTFRDGIPMVEDLELTDTAENVLIYNTRTGEYERVTKSVPNMYEGVGGLLSILEALAVPGRNLVPKFFAYSRALRGYNLMQAGKLVPFENPEESIKQGLAFADEHPEIAIAHANLQKWNEGMVEFLVQTGVMTRDMADVWLQHSDYVPFYLNLDGETNDAMRQIFTEQLGEGADFQILDSLVSGIPSKRYKGFKGQLMEPVEALSKNAFALIQAGLKNVASAKAIDEAMDIAEPMARETTKDKSDLTVRREGKEYYYAVSDPVLLNTLIGAFEGTNPVIEAFGAPARWLREAVTRSPEFMAANMLRDSLSTWVISGGKAGPWDTLSTFGKDLKNWKIGETSETLKILEKTGAIGGYDLQGTSPKALKRYFLKASGAKSGGPMGLGSKLWGDLGDISGLSEAAARQRVYEHVYEITMDKLAAENIRGEKAERIAMREAGFQAQEVLNFSRKGSSPWLKVITATVPFLNARLQGLDRLGRSAFGQDSMVGMSKEEAIRSFILRGSLIAGMTIAYTLMNWEDEEYQNTRQEIRDDNWLIPTGTGNFISIPIPFEVGVLFKVIPEMLTAAALGRAPRELVDSARHALVNTLNFNPLPQAVKPIIEGWTNYNFFTGREIVPFYMEDMISEKQYRPTTTAPAKMLGAAFNVSPMKVENFIRGQFGTIGSYAMSATDAVLHNPAFGYTSRPDRRLTDFPFFRRFMKDEFGTGNKSLYYDMRGEVDGIVATINALSKTEPMEAMKIRREYGGLLRMRDVVNSMDKQMRSLRNRRIQIYVNPSMDPGMKRKLIDNLDRTENRLLKNVPAMRKMADLGIL